MLQEAKSSRRTPDGGDKARVSDAAVEGVRRIRKEVTHLLRSLLLALRHRNISILENTLPKLQEKVCITELFYTSKKYY